MLLKIKVSIKPFSGNRFESSPTVFPKPPQQGLTITRLMDIVEDKIKAILTVGWTFCCRGPSSNVQTRS